MKYSVDEDLYVADSDIITLSEPDNMKQSQPYDNDLTFICLECNYRAMDKSGIKTHLKDVHKDV